MMDAKLIFQVVHALVGPAQHAGHIGANFNMIRAFRLLVEHIVKPHDCTHFGGFQIEHLG